ncbi:unnamed protein product, partial [Nesidiocoris tenuis]
MHGHGSCRRHRRCPPSVDNPLLAAVTSPVPTKLLTQPLLPLGRYWRPPHPPRPPLLRGPPMPPCGRPSPAPHVHRHHLTLTDFLCLLQQNMKKKSFTNYLSEGYRRDL